MFENLIFDWSGTLVDDLPIVLDATNGVMRHYQAAQLSREEFRARFRLPYTEFYEETLPKVPMEELEDHFRHHFSRSKETVVILPHARDFLELCRQRGTRCFILSSMDEPAFEVQAAELELVDFFEACYAGVRDKRERIGEIIERFGLDPSHTAFLGDMQHDVETANQAGVTSIALLTGYNDAAQLARSGPDLMVPDLMALSGLISRAEPRRQLPLVTVGALLHREGKLLLVRTHKWRGKWGIPGGKVESGESLTDALQREIREETGLTIDDVRLICALDSIGSAEFYKPAHFVLLNYLAAAGSGTVSLNQEAEEFRWVTLDQALNMDVNQPTRDLLNEIMKNGLLPEAR